MLLFSLPCFVFAGGLGAVAIVRGGLTRLRSGPAFLIALLVALGVAGLLIGALLPDPVDCGAGCGKGTLDADAPSAWPLAGALLAAGAAFGALAVAASRASRGRYRAAIWSTYTAGAAIVVWAVLQVATSA